MTEHHPHLRRLLRPDSVAVFGGDEAQVVIAQCERMGFAGHIWPVNPNRANLAGRPCYRSVAQLPYAPDASFIAVPPRAAVDTVEELAARDAGGAVVYTSGFAEVGGPGRALQDELVARSGTMALLGPNSYGALNYLDGVALWPDAFGGQRATSGVAIVSQSGNIAINLSMQARSVPLAYVLTVGNQAKTSFAQLLHAILQDPRVSAVGMLMEGIADAQSLASAALAACAHNVPLVVCKLGSSQAGAELTLSHTATLSGDDAACDAFFNRYAVARVDTLPAFLETLKFLHINGPLQDINALSMSCSGGEAALVADLAETYGVHFPAFKAADASELAALAKLDYLPRNPFDYHTYIWGDERALRCCFERALELPVDVALLVLDMPDPSVTDAPDWMRALHAFAAAVARSGVTGIVASSLPENLPGAVRVELIERGIVPVQGLAEALQCIAVAGAIGRRWAVLKRDPPGELVVSSANPSSTQRTLDEWASKEALRAFGITTPNGRCVAADEVIPVARALGFPLVLKAVHENLVHKSDTGAVALGLQDIPSVECALSRMRDLSDRFLLERMVQDSVAEILIGVRRDEQFGFSLVLGAGGVLVELMADTRTILLPCNEAEIIKALSELKVSRLLSGFRGRARVPLERVADVVQCVAQYALTNANRLIELDLNPLLVTPSEVLAVDALIRLYDDSPQTVA